ncbi:MAG: TetR/AcrR family transcriptional regulator [Leifsonia sp.]
MAQTSSTRDRILDAYQDLLIDGGERAATLDAVSASAGVSKGGLLYHFASKDALSAGLLDRLRDLAAEDARAIRSAESGAVDYFIRNSVDTGSPLDRCMIAAYRLAHSQHAAAKATIATVNAGWLEAIEDAVGDAAVARLILLVSDGLYYNSALDGDEPAEADLDALLAVIRRLG